MVKKWIHQTTTSCYFFSLFTKYIQTLGFAQNIQTVSFVFHLRLYLNLDPVLSCYYSHDLDPDPDYNPDPDPNPDYNPCSRSWY